MCADVRDVHIVDFSPSTDEAEGMGEEHGVGREEVAVGGVVDEFAEPDAEDEGDEDRL